MAEADFLFPFEKPESYSHIAISEGWQSLYACLSTSLQ
jgi:hypothetical protein